MFLDSHPPGPLDGLWASLAAKGGMSALSSPWSARDKTGACPSGQVHGTSSVPGHVADDAHAAPLL